MRSMLTFVSLAACMMSFSSTFVAARPSQQVTSKHPLSQLLSRSRRQSAGCLQCSLLLTSSQFTDCSTELTDIFSNTGTIPEASDQYCNTLHCPQVLTKAYTCYSTDCATEPLDESIFDIINQSCYRNQYDKTCVDAWISFETDGNDDTSTITQYYKSCLDELSCDSSSCRNLFDYFDNDVGCCYYAISGLLPIANDDSITSLMHRCGETSLFTKCEMPTK